MKSYSHYSGIGNLTEDAKEIEGAEGVSFSVAVSHGKEKECVDYYSCSLWGKERIDSALKYLRKGRQIFFEARPRTTKKEKVTYWNFVIDKYQLLDSSRKKSETQEPEASE